MKEVKRVKCDTLEVVIIEDNGKYTKRVIIPADKLIKVKKIPCGKCNECISTKSIKEILEG